MTSGRPTESIYSVARRLVGPRSRDRGANQGSSTSQSRRRKHQQCYSVSHPDEFRLEKFAGVNNLHSAYRALERDGGHGAGTDGIRFEDVSPGAVFDVVRQLSRAIRDHDYKPYETRTKRIPKGDGRYGELNLQRIFDRTAAKALQICLNPYWRSRLPGIGRSVWHIYRDIERVMRERNAYVLAVDDVENCFPSAKLEDVFNCHRDHITQSDLLWLIEQIVRGHDGLEHTTGLDQGSPYSPVAMELLLHTHLDGPLETRRRGFLSLHRYVDNLTIVCGDTCEGNKILTDTRELLAEIGMTLKGKDGEPEDVRDPNFNKTILGLIPRWKDGQLKLSIPESGFENLKDNIQECLLQPNPEPCDKQIVGAWINTLGPTFTSTETPENVDRIISITQQCGLHGFSRKKLHDMTRQARARWIKFCREREESNE